MPRANWGITADDVDDFDRESMFKPYAGPPVPVNQVYLWEVKVLKYAARTRTKNAQMRVGLELVPREGYDEDDYAGYFIMDFIPVTSKTNFRYTPFLDCLGVSGKEFEQRTMYDEDGNIQRIGSWRNNKDTLLYGQLQMGEDANGEPQRKIGAYMPYDEDEAEEDLDDEEYADEED